MYKHLLTATLPTVAAPSLNPREAPASFGSAPPSQSLIKCRESLLARDAALHDEYTTLVVVGKVVSEDDFWSGEREQRLYEEYSRKQLVTGYGPSALVEGKSTGDATSQEQRVEFSKEIMERIFVEHPGVLRVYEQQVQTGNMDETQFWTAYMQSKYVLARARPNLEDDRKRMKHATTAAQFARAQALFGTVDDYRLERGGLGADERVAKPRLDPGVDLVRIRDDAETTAVGGFGAAGYGLPRRDGVAAASAKAGAELARSLKAQGRALSAEDVEKIDAATAGSAPLLSLYNRRGTVALHPELKPQAPEAKLPSRLLIERKRADLLREERQREEIKLQATLDGDLSTPEPAFAPQPLPMLTRPVKRVAAAAAPPAVIAIAANVPPAVKAPTLGELKDDVRAALLTELKAVEEICRHFWRAHVKREKAKMQSVCDKVRELMRRVNVDVREWLSAVEPRAVILLRPPLAMMGKALDAMVKAAEA